MFQKKILLNHSGKVLKYKYKNKLGAFYYFHAEVPQHLNSQKLFFSIPTETNVSQKTLLSKRKLLEIKSYEKYMSEISDTKCWKCNQLLEVKNFSCTSCGALQYPKQKVNYFELLGISQMYTIDLDELTQNFRNKQKIFHPDKFATKSKEELEISEAYSTLLNKAFATLKDPLARGFYLLESQKVSTEADFPLEQEFLLTIMETNEELEHIQSIKKILTLMKINDSLIKKQIALVGEAFHCNNLKDAKVNLLKLNYYMNLNNKMKEIHSNLIASKYT